MEDLSRALANYIPAILDAAVELMETRVTMSPPIWMLMFWGLIWLLSLAYARLGAMGGGGSMFKK